jgi:hypothetical protein
MRTSSERPVHFRHRGTTCRGFTPTPGQLALVNDKPTRRVGWDSDDDSCGATDDDVYQTEASPKQSFSLPVLKTAAAVVKPSVDNRARRDANGRLFQPPSPQGRKVVNVAKIVDPVQGRMEWEKVEIRYGEPKALGFALNCTFGLPRVLSNSPPPRLVPSTHQKLTKRELQDRLLHGMSATPDPSSHVQYTVAAPGSTSGSVVGSPGAVSLVAGRSGPRRSKRGTPAPKPLVDEEEARRRAAEEAAQYATFEDFVRPRDKWPASESARRNVHPIASVVRDRRRQATGDSSCDRQNQIDPSNTADRLRKLLDRQQRLKKAGAWHEISPRGRRRDTRLHSLSQSAIDAVALPLAQSPSSPTNDAKRTGRPMDDKPDLIVKSLAASVLEYEVHWAREQLRRAHEAERMAE